MDKKPSSESQITTIDVLKANDLLHNSNYRYLDVRTEEEFNKGHVDYNDVLNIAYMFNTPEGRVKNPKFMEQVLPECTKDEHLIGCQSGVRSVYATIDLLDAGFKYVYNMGGGYLAWVQNGLPVIVETPNNVTPNVIPNNVGL
uniref:thiosulfate sulfurtransferase 18-like isoform X2 n=1 Tax=Erigeron canadensis TaxID=72917 RepID=UPI001CB8AEAF|nr:thiosulfate sulfurtransferase 18-like isoform X2 [Erigeron canadensis]